MDRKNAVRYAREIYMIAMKTGLHDTVNGKALRVALEDSADPSASKNEHMLEAAKRVNIELVSLATPMQAGCSL